jgi:hypothetical protein
MRTLRQNDQEREKGKEAWKNRKKGTKIRKINSEIAI